jgi:hypothetical protein
MTDEEAVIRYTLQAELDDLEAEYAEAPACRRKSTGVSVRSRRRSMHSMTAHRL